MASEETLQNCSLQRLAHSTDYSFVVLCRIRLGHKLGAYLAYRNEEK